MNEKFLKHINFSNAAFKIYNNEFRKQASLNKDIPSEILSIADEAYKNRKSEKNIIVLSTAVFPYEYFGPNENGDIFFEDYYEDLIYPNDPLPKSFKTFFGKQQDLYHDLKRKIGIIHGGIYDSNNHRVELVSEIYFNNAPDIINKLKAGFSLAVSMMCSIKYDICTVCGHVARTLNEHCEHTKYHIGEVINGIPVGMINVGIEFVELSIVVVPGDQNARIYHVHEPKPSE